jgi:DNA modification methylase
MPESVTDRPTKAHEYVFLLAKSERYYYDADAVKEAATKGHAGSRFDTGKTAGHQLGRASAKPRHDDGKRNARSVWSIATQPSGIEHFAMMPPALAQRCILAGSAPGDMVLDPFNGVGTTGLVAMQHGRRYIGAELSHRYADASVERWRDLQRPLFAAGGGL